MNEEQRRLEIARQNYATNCEAIKKIANAIVKLTKGIPQPKDVTDLIGSLASVDISQAAKDLTSGELIIKNEKTKADLRGEARALLMCVDALLPD